MGEKKEEQEESGGFTFSFSSEKKEESKEEETMAFPSSFIGDSDDSSDDEAPPLNATEIAALTKVKKDKETEQSGFAWSFGVNHDDKDGPEKKEIGNSTFSCSANAQSQESDSSDDEAPPLSTSEIAALKGENEATSKMKKLNLKEKKKKKNQQKKSGSSWSWNVENEESDHGKEDKETQNGWRSFSSSFNSKDVGQEEEQKTDRSKKKN